MRSKPKMMAFRTTGRTANLIEALVAKMSEKLGARVTKTLVIEHAVAMMAKRHGIKMPKEET